MYYYEHHNKGECKVEAETDELAMTKIKDLEGQDLIGVAVIWVEPGSDSDPSPRTLWME